MKNAQGEFASSQKESMDEEIGNYPWAANID